MKRIHLIDDDLSIQAAFRHILSPDQFYIDGHIDGTAVLENNFILPDLFIIDKQLRGVDGLDVCSFLKRNAETQSIPIIVLSASPYILRPALAAGADYVLEKPFGIADLRRLVERLIGPTLEPTA
ncbi:MAG: response regulator [Chitinophagaceae bacterium]|nr:MAG: response regulator [Chitinophagaceae bacterium]